MDANHFQLLKAKLQAEYVPHLPPLLPNNKTTEHNTTKNLSRAFSAWTISQKLRVSIANAAQSVIDDFDDAGIDAVYYDNTTRVLYLVQGKLKEGEDFSLAEAQKLLQGTRDLLNQRYATFNQHVLNRQAEIEHALEDCREIELLIAFTGNLISRHAADELARFLSRRSEVDERLRCNIGKYEPDDVTAHLLATQAQRQVKTTLTIMGCQKIESPRICYYGHVAMADLVQLFLNEKNALFAKNIRHFLGMVSTVNQSIQASLQNRAHEFLYLSNGVTAIAETIEPAANVEGGRRLKVTGLSVINGAQSIAAVESFQTANPDKSISAARVLFTLIHVPPADTPFAADVTKARNHQNPVAIGNFAALDPIHERLRRELSLDGVEYLYRPEDVSGAVGRPIVRIQDAALALAIFSPKPNYPVVMRTEPSRFTNRDSLEYSQIFNANLSGRHLANATRLYLAARSILAANEAGTNGEESRFYRHGWAAVLWVTFQKNLNLIPDDRIISDLEAAQIVSQPVDHWRQQVWEAAESAMSAANKGPLAFFKNLTDTRPFLIALKNRQEGA